MIYKACQPCQAAKVRRQQLSAAFEQADKEDLPLLRQAYGILLRTEIPGPPEKKLKFKK
jgi:hypothetical protein